MLGCAIILSVLLVMLFVMSSVLDEWDVKIYPFSFGLIILAVTLGAFIHQSNIGDYNDGQIDALKGVQTHEIVYKYHKGDTIPFDSLYVKKE